jgi:hypothetical protein
MFMTLSSLLYEHVDRATLESTCQHSNEDVQTRAAVHTAVVAERLADTA